MERRLREVVGRSVQQPERGQGRADETVPATPSGSVGTSRLLGLVVVAAAIGALLGASLHPLPTDRFQADAIVVVQPDVTGSRDGGVAQAGHWRAFADAVELPQVAEAAARASPAGVEASDIPERVRAVGDPSSNIVRVRARGASFPDAVALADAVAAQAVGFMRRAARSNLVRSDPRTAYDFEDGLDGWTAGSLYSTPSESLNQQRGGARTGNGRLSFVCDGARAGCGPGATVSRPFGPGTRYLAQAYVRASGNSRRMRLVLGSDSRNVAAGEPVRVDHDGYKRLTVAWTPSRHADNATLALQTTERGRVAASVDTAIVVDPTEGPVDEDAAVRSASIVDEVRARRAAAGDRYANIGAAASAGVLDGATWRWSLFGAALGVLAAGGGLALAAAARRRRQ